MYFVGNLKTYAFDFFQLERDEDDQLMSDIMVKYWTNFAKVCYIILWINLTFNVK